MCKTNYTRVNNPYESIISQYRTNFQSENSLGIYDDIPQLKKQCVKRAIAKKSTDKYGKDPFIRDTGIRVKLLNEHLPFQRWCQDHGLDVYAASTHVVMLGTTILRKIMCDDIINRRPITLDYYPDWNTPLFDKEELGLESAAPASTSDEQSAA